MVRGRREWGGVGTGSCEKKCTPPCHGTGGLNLRVCLMGQGIMHSLTCDTVSWQRFRWTGTLLCRGDTH